MVIRGTSVSFASHDLVRFCINETTFILRPVRKNWKAESGICDFAYIEVHGPSSVLPSNVSFIVTATFWLFTP